MAIKKGVYNIPNEDGTEYDEIHLRTDADMVQETANKNFVSFATDLKSTSKDNKAVVNANVLGGILSNCKIVISNTKPPVEEGYNILWINLNAISYD